LACCLELASPGKAAAAQPAAGFKDGGQSCNAGSYQCSFSISPYELRCDGDSAHLIVRITQDDGTPVVGYTVWIKMNDGTVTIPRRQHTQVRVITEQVTGRGTYVDTDRRGMVEAFLTPDPGHHSGYAYHVTGGNYVATCPFSTDRAYVVSGNVFLADHSRGADLARTRDGTDALVDRFNARTFTTGLGNQQVALFATAPDFGCVVPVHTQRVDRGGSFSWTGLGASCIRVEQWSLCVVLSPRVHTIVSVNGTPVPQPKMVDRWMGSPVAPMACVPIGSVTDCSTVIPNAIGVCHFLQPGVSSYDVGVR
jgi:hypothetical protein